jgi:hypothetical protein
MNLRVKLNYLLPVWLLIWLTAVAVFTDLAFLEIEHAGVVVTSLEIKTIGYKRPRKVCEIGLQLQERNVQRSTDSRSCQLISVGDSVKLKESKLLRRWLALYNNKDIKISEDTLEDQVWIDGIFVILALLMPMVFMFDLPNKIRTYASIVFGFQVFGVLYFWSIFLK